MGRHLLKIGSRLVQFILTVFLLWNLGFVLLNALPGSPFAQEANLKPQFEQALRQQYGLGASIGERYFLQLKKFLQFDFGPSSSFEGKTANQLIVQTLKTSSTIMLLAFALSMVASFLLTMGSYFGNQLIKSTIDSLMTVVLSLPQIFLVPVAVWFFGFHLKIFPIAFLDSAISYILPVTLLALRPVFVLYRFLTEAIQKTEKEAYSINAKAMGFSKSKIFFRFLVPNSISVWVQHLGSVWVHFFSGTLLIEMVFSYEGMGSLLVKALGSRDFTLSLAIIIVIGTMVSLMQMIADLINSLVDPRLDIL
jgi:ABC-type dipeptide/oligopeptide/nickel transport system permease component